MFHTTNLHPAWRATLWTAVAFSVVMAILSLLALDFGQSARLSGVGLAAFWSATLLVLWRRPGNPSRWDLVLIRWGCVPFVIGFQIAVRAAWQWCGVE